MAEAFPQADGVVGVDLHVVRGARDGDVGESGVDELRMSLCIHIDEGRARRSRPASYAR